MPTVLRVDGFDFKILGPPREHGPPHVHVYRGKESLVIVRLALGDRPLRLWKIYGMRNSQVLQVFRIVDAHQDYLLQKWQEIHGQTFDYA